MITKKNTQIEMVGEVVNIYISKSEFHTTAEFSLHNSGKAVTTDVGFPFDEEPRYQTKPKNFQASIANVPVTTIKEGHTPYEEPGFYKIDMWKHWTMHLDAGQNIIVHVSYDNDMVPTSDSTNAFDQIMLGDGSANSVDQPAYRELVEAKAYNVQYILITGSRWKGPIGDCRIIVHTDKIGREKVRSVAPLPDAISDKEIIWHWRNFKPHADLRISLFDKRTLSSQIEQFRAACAKRPNDAKLVACLG